jgi:hypothetical protein
MYIWNHIKFDNNNIPIQIFNGNTSYISDNGIFYSPCEISNCAISLLQNYYNTNNNEAKSKFIKYVDFCINKLEDYIFYYEYDAIHVGKKLKKRWYSALSQGNLIVIFSHAYKLTSEEKYKKNAYGVFNLFLKNDPNLIYYDKLTNSIAAQEYNNGDEHICVVMNGLLYTLSSFIEFYKIFKAPICFRMIECFTYFLKTHYKCYYYDKTFSYYCLHKTPKTKGHLVYHRLILQILDYLNIIFPSDGLFKKIIETYIDGNITTLQAYIDNIIECTK